MIFEWPMLLWGWLAVPLLALAYVRVQRRRVAATLGAARWSRHANAAPVPPVQRLLPPLLYALALTLLITAAARPMAVVSLPSLRDVIILAVDVSHSMRADDLKPTRLAAAQQAARAFIEEQPSTTRIGLVAFAGTALAVQRPTTNREELLKAIERLEPQKGTAVGEAMLVSLQALFPKEVFELKSRAGAGAGADADADAGGAGRALAPADAPTPPASAAPGSEKSAAIVLLTDGAATGGPDPVEVARLAAGRGVRVFTVGLGTEEGAVVELDGISMRVQIDEEKLREVADVTRARYFRAEDADDLRAIYRDVSARLVLETRETEISAAFVAAAAVLALLAAGSSLFWFNRIL
jgi:Ca-activated chloride channel family protein